MSTEPWVCKGCETAMPPDWPMDYPCPKCYPNIMWEVYSGANPIRLLQEGNLYFKFDYSCIRCRLRGSRKHISWVIRRFRVKRGMEDQTLLEDPAPPLQTCKTCFPGPHGMWKRARVVVPPEPSSEGAEDADRHSYRRRTLPAWVSRVNSSLEAVLDQQPDSNSSHSSSDVNSNDAEYRVEYGDRDPLLNRDSG